MSATMNRSAAEFDKGAQGARALLARAGVHGRSTPAAARPLAASPDAVDAYERGAAAARSLLALMGAPAAYQGSPRERGAASADAPGDHERGAAEARRLLGYGGATADSGGSASSPRSPAERGDGVGPDRVAPVSDFEKGAAEARALLGIRPPAASGPSRFSITA